MIVGVNVTFVILGFVLPFIDNIDFFLLMNPVAPVVMVTIALLALHYHPCEERWNDARADTTVIIGVVNGVYISSWIMCQLSALEDVLVPIPHEIRWPGFKAIPVMFIRELIGTSIMVIVHLVVRVVMLKLLSIILGRKVDRKGPKEVIIEFPYKYVSYLAVGASAFLCLPIFPLLGI